MRDYAKEAVALAGGLTLETFKADRMAQLALIHLVEIVGEAASRVSAASRAAIPAIPWPKVIGTRNRIVHGYDKIDLPLLWDTLRTNLPPLIAALDDAIAGMEAERKT
jgi:uncharacterized protein with HEPN domain